MPPFSCKAEHHNNPLPCMSQRAKPLAVIALVAMSLLLTAATARAQENEAEKLYRAMAKKVQDAKSLRVISEGEADFGSGNLSIFKGSAQLSKGNKVRIEFDFKPRAKDKDKGSNFLLICNGRQAITVETHAPPSKAGPADPTMRQILTSMFVRGSFMLSLFIGYPAPGAASFDAEKEFPAADFKFAGKERLWGREIQIIEYTFGFGLPKKIKVKLWIDPKTSFPLKRELRPEDRRIGFLRETYTGFAVDVEFGAKVFELSR